MIDLNNVGKTFDGFRALDGLELHVPAGAVYGLVGPNGAGKTTAIRHITGVYRQDSGTVTVGGEPVFENPRVKGRIACIPDEIWFFPQASIRDMMRWYRGIRLTFDGDRYEKLRDVFGLDDRMPMRRLSRGMQKQAAFWLSLCMRPEVLVLDEPVDGLDPVMRRQVWSLVMADAAENGTTVLVSSHNLRELEDVCDHVGIVQSGKMLLERSLSELQENIVKVQYVYPEGGSLPMGFQVLHESAVGKVHTAILRGRREDVTSVMAASAPVFFDVIPLSLEEIFIYELGGADYAVKDVIL